MLDHGLVLECQIHPRSYDHMYYILFRGHLAQAILAQAILAQGLNGALLLTTQVNR